MIVSIGREVLKFLKYFYTCKTLMNLFQVYLANTKGPLITEHLLIAPINHYKSFTDLPSATEKEINL